MGQITVEKNMAGIEGLCVITPKVHGDSRGYFMETYSQRDMEENGIHINFVQDNQSMSVKVFCVDCISRKTSPRPSWFASSRVGYLMWQ